MSRRSWRLAFAVAAAGASFVVCTFAMAHGVSGSDGNFLGSNAGFAPGAYLYLGAKHMVTGYDHLLFLAGVVFFLYRLRDVGLYVTLFAIGHSVTLLLGVLADIRFNPFLVDAIIGLSVAYKALDNMGALAKLSWYPDLRWAVLGFGFCHGFGLATKLQDLNLHPEGLVANMLAFNLGVEVGQLLALALILGLLNAWRTTPDFRRWAVAANWCLLVAGFSLTGYQIAGYQLG